MNKEWREFYNPNNFRLIHCLSQLKDADLRIEIHEKRPVNLFIDEPVYLINVDSISIDDWGRLAKTDYYHLLKDIENIRFGEIILKIRDRKIIESKKFHKIRLQIKNAKQGDRKISVISGQ